MKIFENTYCGEGMIDVEQDVGEAFSCDSNPAIKKVPVDEYGIFKGQFRVTIEWIPEEDE